MNLKEIDRNGTVEGFVLVKSCDKKTSKNGSTYLDMTLCDKSGEVNAKLWDFRDGMFLPAINTIVKVRGALSTYNGVPQLRVDRVRQIWDSDNVNMSDFVPTADLDPDRMLDILEDLVTSFTDEDLKKIVLEILDRYGERMLVCPAAFRLHHAIRGGLLMHTLSIVRLCQRVSDIYPSIDRELLIAGAILHDVCKTEEFELSPTGLADGYSVQGTLIGHLVMGAQLVREVAADVDADPNTAMLLEHMIISHHGEPEFGAAVRPLFLEAEVLSELDTLDARIFEIEKSLQDVPAGGFSQRQWALNDRKFYNHGRKPTEITADIDDPSFE